MLHANENNITKKKMIMELSYMRAQIIGANMKKTERQRFYKQDELLTEYNILNIDYMSATGSIII